MRRRRCIGLAIDFDGRDYVIHLFGKSVLDMHAVKPVVFQRDYRLRNGQYHAIGKHGAVYRIVSGSSRFVKFDGRRRIVGRYGH